MVTAKSVLTGRDLFFSRSQGLNWPRCPKSGSDINFASVLICKVALTHALVALRLNSSLLSLEYDRRKFPLCSHFNSRGASAAWQTAVVTVFPASAHSSPISRRNRFLLEKGKATVYHCRNNAEWISKFYLKTIATALRLGH